MTNNTIINKEVDVVHLRSEIDLILETNTQIKLSTNNILINYVPFDEYIRNIVFDTAIVSVGISNIIHYTWAGDVSETDTTKIDLTTNTSEFIVDEIHTSGVSATHSHINNKVHFINLSAANNVQLSNLSNSSNIIYNHQGTKYSLSNYIYKVINTPVSHTPVTLSPNNAFVAGTTGIDTLGTYVGNKIITNKLTTVDVMIGGYEPILELNSETAINFMTDVYSTEGDVNAGLNILFGSLSLDSLVKSQLDENGLLDLQVTLSSGQNIGMTIDSFSNGGIGVFIYTVVFKLYEHPIGTTLNLGNGPHPFTLQVSIPSQVYQSFILGDGTYPLEAGKFYTVVATFTNLRTNTVVENVILEPRSVATIEFITGLSVTIVNETAFNVTFTGHATQVPGITVTFKVKMGWGSESLIPYYDSSQTQNLGSESSQSINFNLLTSRLSSTNYGTQYVKNRTAHTFDIQSESSSFTIMNTPSFTLPAFDFPSPQFGTGSLTVTYNSPSNYTFNWPTASHNKLSIIRYKLTNNNVVEHNDISTTSKNLSESSSDMAYNWNIVAYNVYGDESDILSKTILNPTFTVQNGTYTPSSTRQFQFSYTISNFNTRYSISGGLLNTISNLTSSSGTINTSSLSNTSTQTNFIITLQDSLGFIRTVNKQINVNNPSINSFGSFFTYSSTLRFYVTVSVSNPNLGSWGITSNSISGGSSLSVIGGSNIYVTFSANDTGSNKSVSVTIKDSYGYTASRTANVNLSVIFTGSATNLPVNVSGTEISFTTSGLTSYKWYLNNSLIHSATSSIFTMTASNFGSIHCEATETNAQGFTRTVKSVPTINTPPTLATKSFTGFDMSTSPPTPIYTYTLGFNTYLNDTIVNSISMNPTTFNGDNTYILNGIFKNQHGVTISIEIGRHTVYNPVVTIQDLTINTGNLGVNFVSSTNNVTYTDINIYIDNVIIYTFLQNGDNFTLHKNYVNSIKPNFYENGVNYVIKIEYVYEYYSNIYNTIHCIIRHPNVISYTINVDGTNSISVDNVIITGNNHDIFEIVNIYYKFGNSTSFMSQSTSNSIIYSTLMSNSLLSPTQHIEVIVNYKLKLYPTVYSLTKSDQVSWNINTNIVLHEFAIVDGEKFGGLKYQLIGVEIEPTSTIFGIQLSNCTFSNYNRFSNIRLVSISSIPLYKIYYEVFGYDGDSSKLDEARWLYATPAFSGNMYDSYYYSNLSIDVFHNGNKLATLSSASKRSCIYENDRGGYGRHPNKWVLLNMQIPASTNDWETWWDFKMDNGNTWYNSPAPWMLN